MDRLVSKPMFILMSFQFLFHEIKRKCNISRSRTVIYDIDFLCTRDTNVFFIQLLR